MRKRYPHTLWMLMLLAVGGAVIASVIVWPPSAYILIGAWGLFALVTAVREDRKRRGD